MTTKTFDAFTVRDTGDKPIWLKIGAAFSNQKGLTVLLDAMPATDLGQYKIILLPPSENKPDAKRKGKS